MSTPIKIKITKQAISKKPRKAQPKKTVNINVKSAVRGRRQQRRKSGATAIRSGRGGSKVVGLNYMATDGINSSRVVTNMSTVEDTFQIRREKVANVVGTSAFTLAQTLYLNPGNTTLFPIFSQIAATYERYRCNFLRFTYETRAYTAVNSASAAGLVLLATNFDPDDASFVNDTQMENYVGCAKGPVYAPIIEHDVVVAGRGRKARGSMGDFSLNDYFVYSSANSLSPVTGAGKFYDMGLFQCATSGNAETDTIGELFVEYSFTMINPKQQTPIAQNVIAAHYSNGASANATQAAPMTPSGNSMVQRAGSTLNLTFTANTAVIPSTFSGRLIGQAAWITASNDIAAVPSVSASAGGTLVNYIDNNQYGTVGLFLAAGGSSSVVFMVDCVSGATLTFSGNTSMASASVELVVAQISSGLTLDSKQQVPSAQFAMLMGQVDELSRRVALLSVPSSPCIVSSVDDEKYGEPGSSASHSLTDSTVLRALSSLVRK